MRRGDLTVSSVAYGVPCSTEYFAKTIKIVRALEPRAKFYFFSDEPDYVRDELLPALPADLDSKIVGFNGSDKGYMDLAMIAKCGYVIGSIGSLGVYGAFLGGGCLVTPKYSLVNLEPGRPIENRIDETPTPGLRRIAFDFKSREPDAPVFGVDVDMLANLLKAECSVRDYRSKEEIAAYEEKRRGKRGKKLRRKMEEIGASTMPQYVLRRIRRVWRRVLSAIGPKAIGARAAQRKYEQLLLLGATRETAFRFKARWGFVDASLFSAASSDNLATLADALKQPDAIAKGAFTLEERKQAWRSADFGLEFKVKLQWKEGMPPLAKSQMDEDLADLRVRLEKLAEDFRTRLANDKETLLVYRLAEHEGGKPESGRTA